MSLPRCLPSLFSLSSSRPKLLFNMEWSFGFLSILFISSSGQMQVTQANCCENLDVSVCSDKRFVLLINDSYTGVMQKNPNQSQSDNCSECKTDLCAGCMFSVNTNVNKNVTGHSQYTFLDVKNYGNTYSVYLENKYITGPPHLWYLYGSMQNVDCLPSNLKYKWLNSDKYGRRLSTEGTCPIFPVNPKDICEKQKPYDEQACQGFSKGIYILNITIHKEALGYVCMKCDDPIKKPEKDISGPSLSSPGGVIDASSASKAMESLGSLVADMKNETLAAVTFGDVKGILKLTPKEKEKETVHFGFSSADWGVIDNMDAAEGMATKTVSVSKEAFKKAGLANSGSAFVGVFNFPSLSKDEKNSTILNNEVIAIEMGTDISNLTETINLQYSQVEKGDAIVSCSSWDGIGGKPNWIKDGCNTEEHNNTITCQCSHLTFFAILMEFPGPQQNLSSSDVNTLTHITYIGCGVSMFFLGVALFMHFLLSKAKSSKTTKILINLFLALFLLNLTFLSNEMTAKAQKPAACKFIAGIMHYSMLSTFTWFAIQAFHLYLQLIKVFNINIRYYLLKTNIVGWLPPGLVVIVIFILGDYDFISINTDDGGSVQMCWIKNHYVHYIVNIGYYVLVFAFTFFIFIATVHKFMHLKKMKKGQGQQQSKTKKIFTILGLCTMLGVTWGFAFFGHGALRIPSYYIFTILNSFQGFFLFLYYYKSKKPIADRSRSSFTSSSVTSNSKFKFKSKACTKTFGNSRTES